MSALDVGEVRALLALFVGSDLRDLWLRTAAGTIFMAKPGGGAEPGAHVPDTSTACPEAPVPAPHAGVLRDLIRLGSRIAVGDLVASLEVLGERRPVLAGHAGTVSAVSSREGDFVEFGDMLVSLS